jgi:hypothetical protein
MMAAKIRVMIKCGSQFLRRNRDKDGEVSIPIGER